MTRLHWLWRGMIAVLIGAATAGSLGTFVVEGLIRLLRPWGAAKGVAISLTALLFMTLPMVIYGILGIVFPAPPPFDKETRCRKCGYILRGIREPRCSECGEHI